MCTQLRVPLFRCLCTCSATRPLSIHLKRATQSALYIARTFSRLKRFENKTEEKMFIFIVRAALLLRHHPFLFAFRLQSSHCVCVSVCVCVVRALSVDDNVKLHPTRRCYDFNSFIYLYIATLNIILCETRAPNAHNVPNHFWHRFFPSSRMISPPRV